MGQGSLQLGGHGAPPNHFEILPNQQVTKFIFFLYIIIRLMWLAPEVILSNQVDNTILAIITDPQKCWREPCHGCLGFLQLMLAQWALAKNPGTHEAYIIKIFK